MLSNGSYVIKWFSYVTCDECERNAKNGCTCIMCYFVYCSDNYKEMHTNVIEM